MLKLLRTSVAHYQRPYKRILPLIHIFTTSKYDTRHPGHNYATGLVLCLVISLVLDIRGPVRARYIWSGDSAGVRCGITAAYENTKVICDSINSQPILLCCLTLDSLLNPHFLASCRNSTTRGFNTGVRNLNCVRQN